MDKLPRGIYHERRRGRYRVRLYYNQRVLWRTYHSSPAEAIDALHRGITLRKELLRQGMLSPKEPKPITCLTDLLCD